MFWLNIFSLCTRQAFKRMYTSAKGESKRYFRLQRLDPSGAPALSTVFTPRDADYAVKHRILHVK
jgi:hypothetical protein